MSSETPFKISVSDEQLATLHKKLELAIFPDELEGMSPAGEYGSPLTDMRRLVAHWKDGYDWRKHEARLNEQLPQFTRDIEVEGFGSLNIHYIHKKSEVANAIPLLFVHGWPGSFFEATKILPLLSQASPDHPSFHVIAPSLPGYGFSAAPTKKGFGLSQYAETCHKLMLALGYKEYVTQGGDWGYLITRRMARLYGGPHIKAWHTNFPLGAPPKGFGPLSYLWRLASGYSEKDKAGLKRTEWYTKTGSGYFAIQSTRPQTLGYGLADSPVGLLGWIYEKLVDGTDSYPWTDDEVLTWISIYWFSRAGPTATLRIYCEVTQQEGNILYSTEPTTVPLGFSHFPKEVVIPPRKWTREPNLIFEADHDSGGHFAAYEKPELLVGDVRKMFGKGSRAFGVVPGKNGYA
ncbi:Alpha/Beta hydrolase protein [Infundibulicybe gibba]|nr:Alpha/Beta hydrolase protein [Infundibulicybe gibba]